MAGSNRPLRFLVSPGLTPETETRTRTSPGPGRGSGSSPTCSTSPAGPFSSYQAASTVDLQGLSGSARGQRGRGGARLDPGHARLVRDAARCDRGVPPQPLGPLRASTTPTWARELRATDAFGEVSGR